MKIYILDSKNERKPIEVLESAFVSDVKKQMKEKYKMNEEVELLFNGIILNDNDNLFDLEIKPGSTINYLGQFKAGLNN